MSLLLASRPARHRRPRCCWVRPRRRSPWDTATIVSSALSPTASNTAWSESAIGCTARPSAARFAPPSGAPLRPRCGGVELLEHRRKPVAGSQGDEHANPTAKAGGDGTTNHDNENNLAKFRTPMSSAIRPGWCSASSPAPPATPAKALAGLHAVSAEHARHDRLALQHPGSVLPRSAHPRPARNRYAHRPEPLGNVYPAVASCTRPTTTRAAPWSQRAGDIVTRRNQIHVVPASAVNARDGYWPAGALMETDASTGKWQN